MGRTEQGTRGAQRWTKPDALLLAPGSPRTCTSPLIPLSVFFNFRFNPSLLIADKNFMVSEPYNMHCNCLVKCQSIQIAIKSMNFITIAFSARWGRSPRQEHMSMLVERRMVAAAALDGRVKNQVNVLQSSASAGMKMNGPISRQGFSPPWFSNVIVRSKSFS